LDQVTPVTRQVMATTIFAAHAHAHAESGNEGEQQRTGQGPESLAALCAIAHPFPPACRRPANAGPPAGRGPRPHHRRKHAAARRQTPGAQGPAQQIQRRAQDGRSRPARRAGPEAARRIGPSLENPAGQAGRYTADGRGAEKAAANAQLQGEWGDVTAKLAKLSSEISRRQAEIVTARAAVELERDLTTQRAHLFETQATLRESENARSAYLAEVRRTLYEREAQADLKRQQATQEQAKATQRETLTILKAPVAGVVQQLAIHTTGSVVTETQALMIIVPEGAQVTAEVTLENRDIGFVNAGQDVQIKLETFPLTRYGTVSAKVGRVTADAVNDEKRGALFPAMLRLDTETINVDGKAIRLSPGMNITAEIKTGKRRVIEYLLSPIQTAGSESLRER
jgi:Skp family chaperone for outer membrane proteins